VVMYQRLSRPLGSRRCYCRSKAVGITLVDLAVSLYIQNVKERDYSLPSSGSSREVFSLCLQFASFSSSSS
jgi:hypothetical protein